MGENIPKLEESYDFYTVEHVLRNYYYIRSYLDGQAAPLMASNPTIVKPIADAQRRPMGQTTTGTPWPFMNPNHAKRPANGKNRARQIQELHVSILDIEMAIKHLSKDDRQIITLYYLMGYGLEEVAQFMGLSSKGSMHRRIRAIVLKLLRELNSDKRSRHSRL